VSRGFDGDQHLRRSARRSGAAGDSTFHGVTTRHAEGFASVNADRAPRRGTHRPGRSGRRRTRVADKVGSFRVGDGFQAAVVSLISRVAGDPVRWSGAGQIGHDACAAAPGCAPGAAAAAVTAASAAPLRRRDGRAPAAGLVPRQRPVPGSPAPSQRSGDAGRSIPTRGGTWRAVSLVGGQVDPAPPAVVDRPNGDQIVWAAMRGRPAADQSASGPRRTAARRFCQCWREDGGRTGVAITGVDSRHRGRALVPRTWLSASPDSVRVGADEKNRPTQRGMTRRCKKS
jgi:hypothetical protein